MFPNHELGFFRRPNHVHGILQTSHEIEEGYNECRPTEKVQIQIGHTTDVRIDGQVLVRVHNGRHGGDPKSDRKYRLWLSVCHTTATTTMNDRIELVSERVSE